MARNDQIGTAGTTASFLFAVAMFFICCLGSSSSTAEPQDDESVLFISRFGPPDRIDSSENEKPRPPFVTKFLVYEKENVKVVYVTDGTVPPPYKKWSLIGLIDKKTKKPLQFDEAISRLQKRRIKQISAAEFHQEHTAEQIPLARADDSDQKGAQFAYQPDNALEKKLADIHSELSLIKWLIAFSLLGITSVFLRVFFSGGPTTWISSRQGNREP